jgi:hypothetical protein
VAGGVFGPTPYQANSIGLTSSELTTPPAVLEMTEAAGGVVDSRVADADEGISRQPMERMAVTNRILGVLLLFGSSSPALEIQTSFSS